MIAAYRGFIVICLLTFFSRYRWIALQTPSSRDIMTIVLHFDDIIPKPQPSSLFSLSWTIMDSDSPSPPADATRSLVTVGKCSRMMKGKALGSPHKKLVKHVGGGSKETSAAVPSSTKRKTQHGQKLTG
jgi:hypothetical protein